MKTCTTCHVEKPLDEFNVMRRAPDGRQPRCRDCCKAWYAANRIRHMANTRERRIRSYAETYRRIRDHFDEHPCIDCGEWDLRVLEFDHRDGVDKVDSVSALIREGRPWHVIEAEIEKCDVRCSNCHRRRTAEQFNTWRSRVWNDESGPVVSSRERLARLFPHRELSLP